MKVQTLVDFLVECTWSDNGTKEASLENPDAQTDPLVTWVLYMDGASNSLGSGSGLILSNLEGVAIEYALRFSFEATNNQASMKPFWSV